MGGESLGVSDIRRNLATIESLRISGAILKEDDLESADPELVETFRQAHGQLESLDNDLRIRLGRLAPGDPASLADLDALQERLAHRQARQELGIATEEEVPSILSLKTGSRSWGGAVGLGTFGIAWTSFTIFHAIMMIGGMTKSIGWGVLGLLGFYSIFFLVGFAMLYAALLALCDESVRIDGLVMTIHRKLGKLDIKRRVHLMPGEQARVGPISSTKNNDAGPSVAILFVDKLGKEVSIGQNLAPKQRERLAEQINAYLATQPRDGADV